MSRNVLVGVAVLVIAALAWIVIDGWMEEGQIVDDAQVDEPLSTAETEEGVAIVPVPDPDVEITDSELVEVEPETTLSEDDANVDVVPLSDAAEAVADGAEAVEVEGAVTDAATEEGPDVDPAEPVGAEDSAALGLAEGTDDAVELEVVPVAPEPDAVEPDVAVVAEENEVAVPGEADAVEAEVEAETGVVAIETVPVEPADEPVGDVASAETTTTTTTVPIEPIDGTTGGGDAAVAGSGSAALTDEVSLPDGSTVELGTLLSPEGFDADAAIAYVDGSDLSSVVQATLTAALEQTRDNADIVPSVVNQVRERLGLPTLE